MREGIRWGLSLRDAWRLSPRSIKLFCRARREAYVDDAENLTVAAWKGVIFNRTERLTADTLKELLPQRAPRVPVDPKTEVELEIAKWDIFAEAANKRFARGRRALTHG